MTLEDYVINEIEHTAILRQKLARLTVWERFVLCLYLLGWKLREIAEMAGLCKQSLSATLVSAKKKVGAYWQTCD